MTIDLTKFLTPLYAPADAGEGVAAEAPTGGQEASPGDQPVSDAASPEAPGEATDTGNQPGQGEKSPDQVEAKGEQNTEAETEAVLSAPENLPEEFAADWSAFESDVDAWLKENPNATPKDALKWAAERQLQQVDQQKERVNESLQQTMEQFAEEARKDPEIGGDKFDENISVAVTAVETFGSDGLKQILDETGMGSHPEVVKAFYRAGKFLADPSMPTTNQSTAKMTMTDALYGRD